MAKSKKDKEPKYSGRIGCYYICGGRPNHIVAMPERVTEIVEQQHLHDTNPVEFAKQFPRCHSAGTQPTMALVHNKRTKKLAQEAGYKPLPNGDYMIDEDDPEGALRVWLSVSKINPDAYIHPTSLPIPGLNEEDHKERLSRREKRELQKERMLSF